jgi:hypothetical protein
MSESRTPYSPTANNALHQARDARARAWAFVFDCHAKENAAGVDSTNGDDAKKGSLKHEFRAKASIPETY